LTTSLAPSGFSETYADLVLRLRRESSQRRKSARRTSASGCSSSVWPTPTAQDDQKSPEAHLAMKARMKGGPRYTITSLEVLSKQWPTPMCADGGEKVIPTSAQPGLIGAVANWPTPTSRDYKDTGDLSNVPENCLLGRVSANWATPRVEMARAIGNLKHITPERGNGNLEDQTSAFSLPVPVTPTHGETSSPDAPTSRRQLNPAFVEWLMGWPEEWTNCVSWGTGSYPSAPPSRFDPSPKLSRLEECACHGEPCDDALSPDEGERQECVDASKDRIGTPRQAPSTGRGCSPQGRGQAQQRSVELRDNDGGGAWSPAQSSVAPDDERLRDLRDNVHTPQDEAGPEANVLARVHEGAPFRSVAGTSPEEFLRWRQRMRSALSLMPLPAAPQPQLALFG
jgi:hypothetical protein